MFQDCRQQKILKLLKFPLSPFPCVHFERNRGAYQRRVRAPESRDQHMSVIHVWYIEQGWDRGSGAVHEMTTTMTTMAMMMGRWLKRSSLKMPQCILMQQIRSNLEQSGYFTWKSRIWMLLLRGYFLSGIHPFPYHFCSPWSLCKFNGWFLQLFLHGNNTLTMGSFCGTMVAAKCLQETLQNKTGASDEADWSTEAQNIASFLVLFLSLFVWNLKEFYF